MMMMISVMHCWIPTTITDTIANMGMIWVILNMLSAMEECRELSGNCEGISHCLESGHPALNNHVIITITIFGVVIITTIIIIMVAIINLPLTSTLPHLRCDVGLEEGGYWKKLSLCYSIVYYCNDAQRHEPFLQVVDCIWLWSCLV